MQTSRKMLKNSNTAVSLVVEAAKKAGVPRFVFTYFEPTPDGQGQLATVRMNEIRPREAMSLGLMTFEQAVEMERKNSPDAPTAFHEIMETLLTEVAAAQKKANDALIELKARMGK